MPTTGKRRFTSENTRKLVREAQSFFLGDEEAGDVGPERISELASEFEELNPRERERLEELAGLLKMTESAGGDAMVIEGMSRDGSFETNVSDDRMFLTVRLQPPIAGGQAVTAEAILAHLRERNITQGVELAPIREAAARAAEGDAVEDVVIVRGRESKAGSEQRFEVFGREGTEEDLCKVSIEDFTRTRGVPVVCREGDLILRRIPATPGREGYDALGTVLPPPEPQNLPPEVGPNVRAEGDNYYAAVGGMVIWDGRRIEVRKMLVLNEDLMKTDGEIDFDGDVHIRGAVRSGTVVRATGDIQVDGPVEAADIHSTGGSIYLHHGVAGRRRGIIHACKDVHARFAENVTIIARGSILIDVGSLHSHLTAGIAIRLSRGRGQLLGGVALAGEVVEAKQLGANSGVVTDVTVGLSNDVMDAIGEVDRQLREVDQRREAAGELAEKMKRAIGDPSKLCPDELATYTRLRQAELTCELRGRKLRIKRQEILEDAAEAHGGHVDVLGQLFPRVVVRIGSGVFDNNELRRRCRLQYDEKAHRVVAANLR